MFLELGNCGSGGPSRSWSEACLLVTRKLRPRVLLSYRIILEKAEIGNKMRHLLTALHRRDIRSWRETNIPGAETIQFQNVEAVKETTREKKKQLYK